MKFLTTTTWILAAGIFLLFFNNCAKQTTSSITASAESSQGIDAIDTDDIDNSNGGGFDTVDSSPPPITIPTPNPDPMTNPDPDDGTNPDPGNGTNPDPGNGTNPDPGNGTNPDPPPPPPPLVIPDPPGSDIRSQVNSNLFQNLTLVGNSFRWSYNGAIVNIETIVSVRMLGFTSDGTIRFERHMGGHPQAFYLDDFPNMSLRYRLYAVDNGGTRFYSNEIAISNPPTPANILIPLVANIVPESTPNSFRFEVDRAVSNLHGGKLVFSRLIILLKNTNGDIVQDDFFNTLRGDKFYRISNSDNMPLFAQVGVEYRMAMEEQNAGNGKEIPIIYWSNDFLFKNPSP